MFRFNVIEKLSFIFSFGRPQHEQNWRRIEHDPEGHWDYVTQGLEIRTSKQWEFAVLMYQLGLFQLTATCNNLEAEFNDAQAKYKEAVVGLADFEIEHVKRVARESVTVRCWGTSSHAQIDKQFLMKAADQGKPQVHKAISWLAVALRAEKQIAIQIPTGYHRDYGDLRTRLKSQPSIQEVELELPFFWQEMRCTLVK